MGYNPYLTTTHRRPSYAGRGSLDTEALAPAAATSVARRGSMGSGQSQGLLTSVLAVPTCKNRYGIEKPITWWYGKKAEYEKEVVKQQNAVSTLLRWITEATNQTRKNRLRQSLGAARTALATAKTFLAQTNAGIASCLSTGRSEVQKTGTEERGSAFPGFQAGGRGDISLPSGIFSETLPSDTVTPAVGEDQEGFHAPSWKITLGIAAVVSAGAYYVFFRK